MRVPQKYTEAQVRVAVQQSTSIQGVLDFLGIRYRSGEAWRMIKEYVGRYNLDTSHFKRGMKGKVSNSKSPPEVVLVHTPDTKYRQNTLRLRRALLETGVPYACECGQGPEWKGRKLTLQVDHRDGNWRNNTKQNLRFLCPNCHSQTETHSTQKRGARSLGEH